MQTYYLRPLSDEELDILALNLPGHQIVLFPHFDDVVCIINENYPFVMPNQFIIIITAFGTFFVVIICGTM